MRLFRLRIVVGTFDRKGRLYRQAAFHLREYSRISQLRKYYHV